jgi:hypothetical protein
LEKISECGAASPVVVGSSSMSDVSWKEQEKPPPFTESVKDGAPHNSTPESCALCPDAPRALIGVTIYDEFASMVQHGEAALVASALRPTTQIQRHARLKAGATWTKTEEKHSRRNEI